MDNSLIETKLFRFNIKSTCRVAFLVSMVSVALYGAKVKRKSLRFVSATLIAGLSINAQADPYEPGGAAKARLISIGYNQPIRDPVRTGSEAIVEYIQQHSSSFDIDDDGDVTALTDGLLLLRYLFGFTGQTLTEGAVSSTANRIAAANIEAYIGEQFDTIDLDGNGTVGALTDGLLLLRHLFGFSGSTLIEGAIGPDNSPEFVGSLDIPEGIKERFDEVHANINSVLGSYPNYIYVAYNRNGTEADAQPVFDRLTEVEFWGDGEEDGHTIQQLIDRQSCLGGSNPGGYRTAETTPYSICIENLAFIENPWDSIPPWSYTNLWLHYAHEYFHHYQRVHSLDRGLDYQSADEDDPESSVQAATWWIEGAAVAFQNAWFKANWSDLPMLQGKTWGEISSSIASVSDAWTYKAVRRAVQGAPGETMWGCDPGWNISADDDRYDTASSCVWGATMAVAFMAYKSSYKTVWIDIPQDYYDLGFWGAVEKHLGMTKQEFFDAYNEFLRSGDPEDNPPSGWAPPEGDVSLYADFWSIVPES